MKLPTFCRTAVALVALQLLLRPSVAAPRPENPLEFLVNERERAAWATAPSPGGSAVTRRASPS